MATSIALQQFRYGLRLLGVGEIDAVSGNAVCSRRSSAATLSTRRTAANRGA